MTIFAAGTPEDYCVYTLYTPFSTSEGAQAYIDAKPVNTLPAAEYDKMWDLANRLPTLFFGGGATIGDMDRWLAAMTALMAKAKEPYGCNHGCHE